MKMQNKYLTKINMGKSGEKDPRFGKMPYIIRPGEKGPRFEKMPYIIKPGEKGPRLENMPYIIRKKRNELSGDLGEGLTKDFDGWKYANEEQYQNFMKKYPKATPTRPEFEAATQAVLGARYLGFRERGGQESYKDPKFWEAVYAVLNPGVKLEAREFQWKYGTEVLYAKFNSRFSGLRATKGEFEEGCHQANQASWSEKGKSLDEKAPGFLDLVAEEIRKIRKA